MSVQFELFSCFVLITAVMLSGRLLLTLLPPLPGQTVLSVCPRRPSVGRALPPPSVAVTASLRLTRWGGWVSQWQGCAGLCRGTHHLLQHSQVWHRGKVWQGTVYLCGSRKICYLVTLSPPASASATRASQEMVSRYFHLPSLSRGSPAPNHFHLSARTAQETGPQARKTK